MAIMMSPEDTRYLIDGAVKYHIRDLSGFLGYLAQNGHWIESREDRRNSLDLFGIVLTRARDEYMIVDPEKLREAQVARVNAMTAALRREMQPSFGVRFGDVLRDTLTGLADRAAAILF